MLYQLLRTTARVALRLYYADMKVHGHERIPRDGPLMLVANHPNALVDAMLVAITVERRVFITARATLFESRPLSMVLRRLGVIPLRRARDVPSTTNPSLFLTRNLVSRAHVIAALQRGEAVLVFPEGTSHDGPCTTPLKSGAARLALQAHDARVHNIQILPIGLIYEAKEQINSQVLVRVGVPIDVDAWCLDNLARSPAALTHAIARRLGQAALEPSTREHATDASGHVSTFATSQFLAALVDATAQGGPDLMSHDISERAAQSLHHASPLTRKRVASFVDAVNTVNDQLESRGLKLDGYSATPRLIRSVGHTVRDAFMLLLAPLAVLGRAWTGLLLHTARYLALWSLHDDESRDQPAMRTILIALGLLPLWCGLLVGAGALYVGVLKSLLLLGIVLAASFVHACCRRRLTKAVRQMRAYFCHGEDESFPPALLSRVLTLRSEASALASELQLMTD